MSQLSMPNPDLAILQRRTDLLRQLKRLVPEATLITDREGRRTFETDALTAYRCLPLAVVLPGTTEEVSKILRFCHENHVKVVPRGAGTSLSGGALPLEDAIVLCLSRMSKVLSVDLTNRVARVEAGLPNIGLSQAVAGGGSLLCAGPFEPDRLHRGRQCRHQFRRGALPEIRRHDEQHSRRPHGADERRDHRYRRRQPRRPGIRFPRFDHRL